MTVKDAFEICRYASNQSINGDFSTSEFNRISVLAENAYLNFLLGSPLQYQYQRPVPRVQYSLNQNIRQKVTHLIDAPTTLTIDSNGNANYPTGYILTDAMYNSAMDKINFCSQDRLYSRLKSTLDPIETNPIFLIEKGRFQFYPKNLGTAKISYVKLPVYMKYGFTTDVNGREVYDASSSVQPSWGDLDIYEVIVRILQLVGVNLQLPILYQYAEQVKKEGE